MKVFGIVIRIWSRFKVSVSLNLHQMGESFSDTSWTAILKITTLRAEAIDVTFNQQTAYGIPPRGRRLNIRTPWGVPRRCVRTPVGG